MDNDQFNLDDLLNEFFGVPRTPDGPADETVTWTDKDGTEVTQQIWNIGDSKIIVSSRINRNKTVELDFDLPYLKKQLQEAIDNERYEECALIQQKIDNYKSNHE